MAPEIGGRVVRKSEYRLFEHAVEEGVCGSVEEAFRTYQGDPVALGARVNKLRSRRVPLELNRTRAEEEGWTTWIEAGCPESAK